MRKNRSFRVWVNEQFLLMEGYACSYVESRDNRNFHQNHQSLRNSLKSFIKKTRSRFFKRHAELDMLYNAEIFYYIRNITRNAIRLHYARVNSRAIRDEYDERTKNEILQQAFAEQMELHERSLKLKRLMEDRHEKKQNV